MLVTCGGEYFFFQSLLVGLTVGACVFHKRDPLDGRYRKGQGNFVPSTCRFPTRYLGASCNPNSGSAEESNFEATHQHAIVRGRKTAFPSKYTIGIP